MMRPSNALLRRSPAGVLALLWLLAVSAAAGAAEAAAGNPAIPNSEVEVQPASDATSTTTTSHTPVQFQLADALPGGGDFPVARAVGGLGIVLSLIVGGFVAVRKFAPQVLRGGAPDKMLRVLETLPMGEKRSLAVVQVGDQRLLIGSTSQQISVLSALGGSWPTPREAGIEPRDQSVPSRPPRDSFKGLYETEKGRRSAGPGRAIPADIRAKMKQLREGLEAR